MKVILIGANGTIGKHVLKALAGKNIEVIRVGKRSGDHQVNIEDADDVARLYKKIGSFDAVVNASGDVAFAPLQNVKREQWAASFQSKLQGQINLVQEALPYVNDGGSFTLVSGILGDEHIAAGTVAATVNQAIEGYVRAAATELPKRLRINVVSPTLLEDSVGIYGDFFPGFKPVDGKTVGLAFLKSVLGVQTGQVLRVR